MSFKDRLNSIRRYTTFQEKESLLESLEDDVDIMKVSKILKLEPKNELEANAFILKAISKSVSEILEINQECPNCQKINMTGINIDDMFFKEEIDQSIPEGLFEDLSQVSDKYLDEDLSLEDYNRLESIVLDNNEKIFSNIVQVSCIYCSHKYNVRINPIKFISKFSLTNLYEQYSDITYLSNMTKKDIDEMYPFEREIFLGLLQKKEDES